MGQRFSVGPSLDRRWSTTQSQRASTNLSFIASSNPAASHQSSHSERPVFLGRCSPLACGHCHPDLCGETKLKVSTKPVYCLSSLHLTIQQAMFKPIWSIFEPAWPHGHIPELSRFWACRYWSLGEMLIDAFGMLLLNLLITLLDSSMKFGLRRG